MMLCSSCTCYTNTSSSFLGGVYQTNYRRYCLSLVRSQLVTETTNTTEPQPSSTALDGRICRRLILLRHAHSSGKHTNNSLRVCCKVTNPHLWYGHKEIAIPRLIDGDFYSSVISEQESSRLITIEIQPNYVKYTENKNNFKPYTCIDHDRPLSKYGKADAVRVSHKLKELGWIPQLILCSDAVRTKETLLILQEQVRAFVNAEVHFISSFYSIAAMDGQTAQHLQQAICKLSRDDIFTVMCMGHNRGWEEAATMLSGKLIELKTCNAALLEATGETWEEAFSLAGFGGWKLQGIITPQ